MKTITAFPSPFTPAMLSHLHVLGFTLLLLTVQTKATDKGHYHALEHLQPPSSCSDNDYNIFVKPLPSSFPLKF